MAGRIGELRHIVTLEAPSRTPDEGGGGSESWNAVATLWAAIRATGGGESDLADSLRGRVSHEVVIRNRADVAPAKRFRLGARVFHILAVRDPDGRGRFMSCLAEERNL